VERFAEKERVKSGIKDIVMGDKKLTIIISVAAIGT